ncbi:hypothetical protein Dimus_025434 [Dionaea muscipula]
MAAAANKLGSVVALLLILFACSVLFYTSHGVQCNCPLIPEGYEGATATCNGEAYDPPCPCITGCTGSLSGCIITLTNGTNVDCP